MEPYYSDDAVTIYHGDCREILPHVMVADLLLTDPPYGIGMDAGMRGGGYDGFGRRAPRVPRRYEGGWDDSPPDADTMAAALRAAKLHIVWGGNYLAGILPPAPKWLVWDKQQTMPSYSDAELAWTTLPGVSVKMFRYCGAGLMAREKVRVHPTQKPVALMEWCIRIAPDARLILDPFMGSGSTLVAAKNLGRRAIGIEIEERYCEIAAQRLAQGVLDLGGIT